MPKIRCGCSKLLAYREEQAGKRVKCPACSAVIELPAGAAVKPAPPGVADAVAMLNQRLAAQAAARTPPNVAPRTEPPLAAQPGRTTPGHVMPNDAVKLEAADGDIPLDGEVPAWESGPKPDAPGAETGPRATP